MTCSTPADRPRSEICSVVELRRYAMRPSRRDALIDLFDREFIETQEACGMRIIGQFCDADDPDSFVWMRAFVDMKSRAEALTAFYTGPVWEKRRGAANATMQDSSNVLLLRPVDAEAQILGTEQPRPPAGTRERPSSCVVATIFSFHGALDDAFPCFFDEQVAPILIEYGARPLGGFRTEPAVNTYPALPVRTDEHVFVWLCWFESPDRESEHVANLARSRLWTEIVSPELRNRLKSEPVRLRLAPTARSRLR